MATHPDISQLSARHNCFLVTVATCGRRASLGCLTVAGIVLTGIGREVAAAWDRIGLHRPWVSTGPFEVMPDHVHGLLWWDAVPSNRPTSASIVVGGYKADATRAARGARALRSDQLLWQRGFGSRQITTDASFARAAQFIINNPAVAWAKVVGTAAVRVERESASPSADADGSADADIAGPRAGTSGDPPPRSRGRIP
jgi:hypothetical protein